VHLDARAVELELDRDVGAEIGQCGVERGARAGEHGPHRATDLQAHRLQCRHATGQRGRRGLRQPARQHERPPDGR
jgi:hypothetical protein